MKRVASTSLAAALMTRTDRRGSVAARGGWLSRSARPCWSTSAARLRALARALADDVARCRSARPGGDPRLLRRDRGRPAAISASPGGVLRLEEKQAAAATGQIRLAHAYQEALARHGITVAQILLTLEDTEERRRHLNARATFAQLLALGAVPVVNENDTVATAEIRFGDNDRLAARVAADDRAPTCWCCSPISTVSTPPTRARTRTHGISRSCARSRPRSRRWPARPLPGYSSGGMVTKLAAARIAMDAGCRMLIAQGQGAGSPLAAIEAGARATLFLPRGEPRSARKAWIAGALNPVGHADRRRRRGAAHCGVARACCRPASSRSKAVFERGDARDHSRPAPAARRGAASRPIRAPTSAASPATRVVKSQASSATVAATRSSIATIWW